ncbi:hypothetical protein EDD18DRAFT_1146088 [Armillaria luteobubalina]|uniref:Uncharacterized protein n=1 Tax=Armillaria luteobubalina TaxID=153913 RepID=A0AA39QDC6_9AGAR|nr:hypothetical protein EDD18DRAFT_1146088 [Armillaria luteobubalina]
MPPQRNGKTSRRLRTPAHGRPLLQSQPPPVKVSNRYVLRKGIGEFHVHEVPGSNSLGGLIGHLPSILMLQYVEHNDYLRSLHKKKGIAACRDYRHEPIGYSTVVASYNLGSMKTKFVEWVNTNGQYELTHLDSPSPSAKELRVDMPILFDPSTLEIPGYVLVPKQEYDENRFLGHTMFLRQERAKNRAIQRRQDKRAKLFFEDDDLQEFLDSSGDEGSLQFIGGSPQGNNEVDAEGDPDNGEEEDGNGDAAMGTA